MTEPRSVSPTTSGQTETGALACPRVADLIHYALGEAHGEDHRRVEVHLQAGTCPRCESWLEQAARFRQEPKLDVPVAPTGSLRSVPATTNDPTPIPESARWQKQAFRDLERRLRLLEES